MVHLGGQDQICPNFRQSPLRLRSSRREDRGAKGSRVWGGGVPLPTGERSGEGPVPPPQQIFHFFLSTKRGVLVHLWCYFFAVHLSEFTYSDS